MKPKFCSVIIPVHNDFDHIEFAIHSVKAQELSSFQYKIIVIDDGSRLEDFKKFKEKFDNYTDIQIIRSFENKGPAYARNIGLEMADTEYIAFLDSDDRWPSSRGKLLDLIWDDSCDAVWGMSEYEIDPSIDYEFQNGEIVFKNVMGCLSYKKNEKTKDLRFDQDMRFGEDTDFYLMLNESGARIKKLKHTIMIRNIHGSNMTIVEKHDERKVSLKVLKNRMKRISLNKNEYD